MWYDGATPSMIGSGREAAMELGPAKWGFPLTTHVLL